MTFAKINVRIPTNALDANESTTIGIHTASGSIQWIIVRHVKLTVTRMNAGANPHLVFLQQWKELFVCDCIQIPDNHKLLLGFHQPSDKPTEQRKRRIRNNDIRLIAQRFHFSRTEIAIAFKIAGKLNIIRIHTPGTILIMSQREQLSVRIMLIHIKQRRFLLKQRKLPTPCTFRIRCTNQLFQAKTRKIRREILREVRPLGVIARQQNRLISEHIGIELHISVHLSLNVRILRIELIIG